MPDSVSNLRIATISRSPEVLALPPRERANLLLYPLLVHLLHRRTRVEHSLARTMGKSVQFQLYIHQIHRHGSRNDRHVCSVSSYCCSIPTISDVLERKQSNNYDPQRTRVHTRLIETPATLAGATFRIALLSSADDTPRRDRQSGELTLSVSRNHLGIEAARQALTT